MKNSTYFRRGPRAKSFKICFIFLILSTFLFCSLINSASINSRTNEKPNRITLEKEPLSSGPILGECNITSWQINNTRYFRGDDIVIKGNVSNKFSGPLSGVEVAVVVDGTMDSTYNDDTDASGEFSITYTINENLNLFDEHNISVRATDPTKNYNYLNYLIITLESTSYISLNAKTDSVTTPYMRNELFQIAGGVFYDNGEGVDNAQVFVEWDNGSTIFGGGVLIADGDGEFDQFISVPNKSVSYNNLLKLKFNAVPPYVSGANYNVSRNFRVFSNINCTWEVANNFTREDILTIKGKVYSAHDKNFVINGRKVNILLDNTVIGSNTTNSEGSFTFSYDIDEDEELGEKTIALQVAPLEGFRGSAPKTEAITIEIVGPANSTITENVNGTVAATQPFAEFLTVFIPVLSAIIAGIVAIGVYLLKKREKESRIIEVPLADRIANLKILKDSGRLEEALSYLFEAVYMDLVRAKFSRKRSINETIRDFAIISVKDLKLSPATVYPFIQKVEKVIYYPHDVSDRDFYDAAALFSPIYFQLTGHNFQLKF